MNSFIILNSIFIVLLIIQNINCFTFSVVMAIYNTGRYLDESIHSLLIQTIGYKEIQIILVNDGSTDNSENICLQFQKLFPNNIIYIKIEHGGVSKARNAGMELAKGKYINFLDPDDQWDPHAFEYFLSFIKINKDIMLAAGRFKFFERRTDYHPLDYKFYQTRIVNLTQEYNCIMTTTANCFFHSSYLINKKFREDVQIGEDTLFINELLLINPMMGLIREAVYYYRKREDQSSRTQTQRKDSQYYFSTIIKVSEYLINSSIALYNKIIPFIQYYLGYDILSRIRIPSYKYLNSSDYYNYVNIVKNLLQKIDDGFILEQVNTPDKYKILALSKKYDKDIRNDILFKNCSLKYSNYTVLNLTEAKNILSWNIFSIEENILHIEGIDYFWIPKSKYYYFCKYGNKTIYPKYKNYTRDLFDSLFGIINKSRIVIFDITLENLENNILEFYVTINGISCEIFPIPGLSTRIPIVKDGYYISGNYIIKLIDKRLTLFLYNQKLEQYYEDQYCNQLEQEGMSFIIKLRKETKLYRKKYKSSECKKEIWIINDEKDKAGDNGEYFFRYLREKKPEGIKPFFAINKNCIDYRRLTKLGNVLDFNSDKYLKTFLKSDKIISSVSSFWVDNPFGSNQNYIRDLFNFDFVYIQNGIIKDDLSKYLNRYYRNIKLFVTSAQNEFNSIFSNDYGYNSKNIILTGLPRYDNLEHNKKIHKNDNNRIILVIPTWRAEIKENKDSSIYKTIYSDTFKETKFFHLYNSLINDERLIKAMNLYNYTGIFCLHQSFQAQWIDFTKNEKFIVQERCDYQQLLLKGSLLVTDYSSIFFDFGYLKKPIIYFHFDYQNYRLFQYSQGYFDYEKDGFGPIFKDIDSTINAIIESLKNNCSIEKEYLQRIESFFTFFDENNNERLYKELIKRRNIKYKNPINNHYHLIESFIIILFLKIINYIYVCNSLYMEEYIFIKFFFN